MILSLLVVISVDSAATWIRREALLSRDGTFFGLRKQELVLEPLFFGRGSVLFIGSQPAERFSAKGDIMIRSRLFLAIGTVIVAALLPLLACSPAPKDKPTIRVAPGGDMKLDDLRVEDAAVIDENRIVLVGSKSGPEDADPDKLDANGAIIDLGMKSTRTFTNGHKARIKSVSVGRGRIATVSTENDPALRIWDLNAGRSIKEIQINKIFTSVREVYRDGEPPHEYDAVAWFHKSDRLAIAASEYVILLDPNKPDKPSLLRTPMLTRTDKKENVIVSDWFTKEPLTISSDDAWAACPVGRANIVFWRLKSEEATDVSLIPKGAKDPENWLVHGATFTPSGKLFAWRINQLSGEVPKGKAEKDVPAEGRGVVRIEIGDASKVKVIPLGIGQSIYTLSCAIDPTETWLATGGTGRLDQPKPDAKIGGELRVYHLPSGRMVYRTQPKDSLPLMWLSFTPSGKQIVCATSDGVVRWWDVSAR
jgi:WD40 repeat protein